MITGIDHLVILVRDLGQAIADYRKLGFNVEPGGEHADGSTHNALIVFADGAYLELIAFKEPDKPNSHPWWQFYATGGGLVAYALGSDTINQDAEQLVAAGLAVEGPTDGGRRRPDGERLAWRTLGAGTGARGAVLPFLIEDVTPRALRVPAGDVREHGLPVIGVAGVTVAVADLEAAVEEYSALLGSEPVAIPLPAPAGIRVLRFNVWQSFIELAQPLAADGALAAHLAQRGPGIYSATLSVTGDAAIAGHLDSQLTQGARLLLGPA